MEKEEEDSNKTTAFEREKERIVSERDKIVFEPLPDGCPCCTMKE
jgi:hypothetical protein